MALKLDMASLPYLEAPLLNHMSVIHVSYTVHHGVRAVVYNFPRRDDE